MPLSDEELSVLAKYPFLRDARDYVNSMNLNVEAILNHPIYSACVELGRQRALDSIENRLNVVLGDRLSMELNMLSYPVARLLVNLTESRTLLWRYALGEAEHAFDRVKSEKPEIKEKIKSDLGLNITPENRIIFRDYLALSADLIRKDSGWKLVNKRLHQGFVELQDNEIQMLLKEAVKLRVMEPVAVQAKKTPKMFTEMAKNICAHFALTPSNEPTITGKLEKDALPPCITTIMASLEAGTASHNMMFTLATFLANLGLDEEEIVKIYSISPKFNEEKTRYQIRFLSGTLGSGGGVKYTCPSCTTLKSQGLCVSGCDEQKHPLKYYRRKIRGE